MINLDWELNFNNPCVRQIVEMKLYELLKTEKFLARSIESWKNQRVPKKLDCVKKEVCKLYNTAIGINKLNGIFGVNDTVSKAVNFIKTL